MAITKKKVKKPSRNISNSKGKRNTKGNGKGKRNTKVSDNRKVSNRKVKRNTKGVSGKQFTWKVGDCVKPKGMLGHYKILKSLNDNEWWMKGANRYDEAIPKLVEFRGWVKVKC